MQASAADPSPWLARTKLAPPPPGPDVIARPRVLDLLRRSLLSSRLTLVSAPAGYGKTTLLGALPTVVPNLPMAWLSLDEEDGNPARFLTAVVQALRRPFPGFGTTALSLLAGPPKPGLEPRHVVGALVNELLELAAGDFALVLDDLHLIAAPEVYVALDYLLERMPPQLHVAVATRHDPPLALARLRGRGQMVELRLADVRFTLEETAELLNDRLGLGVGGEDLVHLHDRTEGWPVGLRLVASSLERMPTLTERSAFITDLSRLERHLFGFLAAEVLDRQDAELRSFLLETSILPELTSELCRAVTGRADAAALLEELDRRGLFVVVADGAGAVLRYHALFAEFLQSRLKREWPNRVPELHCRAAEASTIPGRMVAHYLAAGRWEQVATVVEDVAGPMLLEGQAGTVAGWIDALPLSVRAARNRLSLYRGVSALQQGNPAAARDHLERAVEAFQEVGDESTLVEALGHLATCALYQADLATAGETVERALRHPTSPYQRVQLLMTHCHVSVLRRDWSEALRDLDGALAELDAVPKWDAVAALGLGLRMEIALLPGGLNRIERFTRQAAPVLGDGATPLRVMVQELVEFSHVLRGRLDQAIEVCEQILADVRRLGGYPYLGISAAGFGGIAHMARGQIAEAAPLLDFARTQLASFPLGQMYIGTALYLIGRACLRGGDLEGARQICREMWSAAQEQESTEAESLRWKLRGWLALAERRYGEAEQFLRVALTAEERVLTGKLFGTARLSLARLAYDRNRPDEALVELAPLLEECERADTPGLILVDGQDAVPVLRLAARQKARAAYAERLLSLLEPGKTCTTAPIPETGETMTPREVEVLRLIAAGASDRAIADRLAIGESTAKSHVLHIRRKLAVSSRTQAVARGRELGILP